MINVTTKTKSNYPHTIRHAVSLVDVTGAVVAVGLLTLLLVPATASVATNSKNARCLSNLMRIGYANAIYAAQDPADMALPVHPKQFQQCPDLEPGDMCNDPIFVGAYEWGGKSGVGRDDFVPGIPSGPLKSKYGTLAGFGPASRPLNQILFKQGFRDHLHPSFNPQGAEKDTQLYLEVLRCPSDTGYTGVHCPSFAEKGLTSYDHFGTSYNANIFMIANVGGGEMRSNSPYLHRMSDILNPSRTLAYLENNGRFAWTVAPDQCDFLVGVPGSVRGWHGKDWTFNAAFIDGHADTIYMRGYRCEEGVFENQDCQSHSYRCVIVRGEGWQIDTLPAPDVPTRLWFAGEGRPSYEGCIQEEPSTRSRGTTCEVK